MALTTESVSQESIDDLWIIDADSHFTEPPDTWAARVPEAWRDRAPVLKTIDGRSVWFLDGQPWTTIGGNVIRTGREKTPGNDVLLGLTNLDDVDPLAWNMKARLKLLDDMGIWAQVLYPNGMGFSSNNIFAIEDTGQRAAILQTFNDSLADIQDESCGRLIPQALLPIWDMDFTVKELKRLLDRGIRGFTLTDKPELLSLPELPHPYYDPMWDLLNESGTVANFHIGSGASRTETAPMMASISKYDDDANRGGHLPKPAERTDPFWHYFGPERRHALYAAQIYMSNVRVLSNLLYSDLFDRFPKLKIASAESGIGWIPFMLESLEYQFDEFLFNERGYTKRRPKEYFADHIYVMFWFERLGPEKLIDDIGVNNVLIETDVPHPTCLFPEAKAHFRDVLSKLDPHIRRRILQDNGVELYNVELPDTARQR
jgi:predicted TIM-barrel fold metal-dependent hydrolase